MSVNLSAAPPRPSYAGRHTTGANDEIWRLAVAKTILDRGFRSELLRQVKDPLLAPPLEVGIDRLTIAKIAQNLENREIIYDFIYFILFVIYISCVIISAGKEENFVIVSIIFIILADIVGGYKGLQTRKILLSTYFATQKSIDNLTKELDIFPGIGPRGQNVVIYKDFSPFEFAGSALGGWSFAVDLEKTSSSSNGGARSLVTREFLEQRICDALHAYSPSSIRIHDILLVHGLDVDILPPDNNNQQERPAYGENRGDLFKPLLYLDSKQMTTLEKTHPKLARRYLWISLSDWGGELTLSYILRLEIRERVLFIDHSRFVLAPSPERDRPHGLQLIKTWRYGLRRFIIGAIFAPLLVIFSPMLMLGILMEVFSDPGKIYRKNLRLGIPINYGSPQSIRRRMMGDRFTYYAQRHDLDAEIKCIEKITLESLSSALEECGVDVSDLRNKQTTIFNSGVLVQGGDVTAQALAVGPTATATSSSGPTIMRKRSTS